MNILKKFMNKHRLVANVIIKNGLVVQSFKYNNFLPIGKPEAIIKNLTDGTSTNSNYCYR